MKEYITKMDRTMTSCKRAFLCLPLLSFLSIGQATLALAALDMSVMPTDGGNSIRFGKINIPTVVNAEVKIRISSTESKQYQIFQRVQEPFINERGEALDRQIVSASAIIGSNASGTLYIQDVERLNYTDQLVYTSSPDGLSDSFTLIYQIDSDEVKKSGSFFGKILYILRPVGEGNQEEIVLNAFLDAYDEDWNMKMKSSAGGDRIALSTESERKRSGEIEISFSGHGGQELKVYQEIDQYPMDEEGRLLDKKTVLFSVRGGEKGETQFFQPASLQKRRVLIYEGKAREDQLILNYEINEAHEDEQVAGFFRGTVNIYVESDTVNETHPIEFEVDVKPVFELSAEYPEGGVSFKNFLPNSPPQMKEVIVSVHTNLGKPYEVSQNISGPLTNEEGQRIEREFFTIKEEMTDGKIGRIQHSDFTSVNDGDFTLFLSDKNGSPSVFKVFYRLKPYNKMPAGHYRTAVVFSLNEI